MQPRHTHELQFEHCNVVARRPCFPRWNARRYKIARSLQDELLCDRSYRWAPDMDISFAVILELEELT